MDSIYSNFLEQLMSYYTVHHRILPWRNVEPDGVINPYHVLVSEFMLQQTQVERVIPKYEAFLKCFPTLEALARANLSDVLGVWIGLGYNRRAKYLHEAALLLHTKVFPTTVEGLVVLKGVSKNTAAAILTYAFNQKHVFVETNIRTVIIDAFFANETLVYDKDVEMKLAELLSVYEGSYREFYWAMMDYGTLLKRQGNKAHKNSTSYKKQLPFQGSTRQLRGELVRRAQARQRLSQIKLDISDPRLEQVLEKLVQEGLVRVMNEHIEIA